MPRSLIRELGALLLAKAVLIAVLGVWLAGQATDVAETHVEQRLLGR